MIARPKDWNNVQAATERQQLPVGGYVVRIMDAEIKATKNGSEMLAVSVDVEEGEHKGYYAADYRGNTNEDKRWKGIIRLFLPVDDGSDKDEWTKRSFKAFTEALEDSNKGFHWDWDEKVLKGKLIGCLIRNEEWEYSSRTGWGTKPFKFITVEAVRTNKFRMPADKPLKERPKLDTSAANIEFTEMVDDDLPF